MKNFNLGQKCDIRNRLLSLNCTKTSQIFRLKSATSFPKFTHKHKQRSWHSSNFPSSSCGWDGVKELSRNSSCFSLSRHDRLKAGCGKLFRFSLRDISPKALESRDFRTRRTISLIDLTSDFLIKATGTFSSPSIDLFRWIISTAPENYVLIQFSLKRVNSIMTTNSFTLHRTAGGSGINYFANGPSKKKHIKKIEGSRWRRRKKTE